MDEAQLQHLVLVLGNITSDITIDWAEVAQVRGIARKDNATTSFKTMMKKCGIDFANNRFAFIDKDAVVAAAAENKAKPTTPRKRKPKVTEDDAMEGKNGSASPKKKQKGKKAAEAEKAEVVKADEVEKDAAGDEED